MLFNGGILGGGVFEVNIFWVWVDKLIIMIKVIYRWEVFNDIYNYYCIDSSVGSIGYCG